MQKNFLMPLALAIKSANRWVLLAIISFFVAIVALTAPSISLQVGHWSWLQSPVTTQTFHVPAYDSRVNPHPLSFNLPANELNNRNQDIDIKFKFMYYAPLKDQEDMLQTAPYNEGIRLESSKAGNIATLIGTDEGENFIPALINHDVSPILYTVQPNEWHSIRIHAWNKHQAVVWFDGTRVANFRKAINYSSSNIVLGQGYDASRVFDGKIADFSLTHSTLNLTHETNLIRTLHIIGIFALFISFIALLKATAKPFSKDQKIEFFSLFLLLGMIAMVTYNFILSAYYGYGYPYNSFLYPPFMGAFSDYNGLLITDDTLNPYFNGKIAPRYLPFGYIISYPLTIFPHAGLFIMSAAFIITIWLFVYRFCSISQNNDAAKIANFKNVFIISFLTYPFLFSFERGNPEDLVFIGMVIFLYFYLKKHFYKSAVIIGALTAMKVFPILLVGLLLAQKKYKATIVSVISCILLTVVSLLLLHGGFHQNFLGMLNAIRESAEEMRVIPIFKPAFNTDYFTFIRYMHNALEHTVPSERDLRVYSLLTIFATGFIVAYVVFIEKTLWKAIFLLIAPMLLFPIISFEYKLIHLLIPLALFINTKGSKEDNYYLALFVLLFIPANYFAIGDKTFNLSSVIDAVVLTLMMVSLIGKGLYEFYMKKERETPLHPMQLNN